MTAQHRRRHRLLSTRERRAVARAMPWLLFVVAVTSVFGAAVYYAFRPDRADVLIRIGAVSWVAIAGAFICADVLRERAEFGPQEPVRDRSGWGQHREGTNLTRPFRAPGPDAGRVPMNEAVIGRRGWWDWDTEEH
jgi:hypothetical protein